MTDRSKPEARQCSTCGLYVQGSHGMVDCVEEFKRRIKNLTNERNAAQIKLTFAEEQLTAIRRVFEGA